MSATASRPYIPLISVRGSCCRAQTSATHSASESMRAPRTSLARTNAVCQPLNRRRLASSTKEMTLASTTWCV